MNPIQKLLGEIGAGIPEGALEFKAYGNKGRQMATTRTINTTVQAVPVPGRPGKVARLQVTFCANFLDIADAEVYAKRTAENAKSALAALPQEARDALLAELAAGE